MNTRSFRLRMLLAAGCALAVLPAAAQAPDPTLLRVGLLSLDLSVQGCSAVPIDLDDAELAVCGEGEVAMPGKMTGGSEECRLVAGNGGNGGINPDDDGSDLRLSVIRFLSNRGCGTLVDVRPSRLSLAGTAPLHLGCGNFEFLVELAAELQPTSRLMLLDPAAGSPTGRFVGTLALAAQAVILDPGTPDDPVLPLALELDVAGRWSALDADGAAALTLSDSTLVLYVDKVGGSWVDRLGCAQGKEKCSRLCFTAADSRLDALNGTTGGDH